MCCDSECCRFLPVACLDSNRCYFALQALTDKTTKEVDPDKRQMQERIAENVRQARQQLEAAIKDVDKTDKLHTIEEVKSCNNFIWY